MTEYDTIVASGTRSASYTGGDIVGTSAKGAIVVLDVGSIVAGGLTLNIEGKDRVSAKYYNILSSTPILASTTKVLKVYPGITASNNAAASDVLPETWRVTVTAASGVASYTIGASYID